MDTKQLLTVFGMAASVAFGVVVAWPDLLRSDSSAAVKARPQKPPQRSASLEGRVAPPVGAPNVVLVFGCTVRKDQLGVYGGAEGVTPYLDQLAATGVRFRDALSVSSWTRASAVGVLSGQHPLSYNLPEPGRKQSERVLTASAELLAEVLAKAGWMTLGLTANPNLNQTYGMAQGMDRYQDSKPAAFKKNRIDGNRVVEDAMVLLDARTPAEKKRPFYLQLMLIDAHEPRRPSAAQIQAFSAPNVSTAVATYRASLHQLDEAIATLDTNLQSRGYDTSNTYFVFVADHGEGLKTPPHHGRGHGKQMYPTTVEIPWIVRGPRLEAGRVIDGMVSGVDVSPTILGLVGLHRDEEPVGVDLSSSLLHVNTPSPRTRAFAASMFHVADVGSIWTPTRQCQAFFEHDHDKKVKGCFDRQADPEFLHPIEDPALREELIEWRAARIAEGAARSVGKAEISDEVAAQLEALGYAD